MYRYFKYIDFLCLILIYVFCLFPRWKGNRKQLFLKTVLYVYICFVLYNTLMPFFIPVPFINHSFSSANINLIPFRDIMAGYGGSSKELLLNVLMMIPLGILVPFIYKRRMGATIRDAFAFSLVIEVLQIFSRGGLRGFDVTDLISNTLGGAAGYSLYKLISPAATPIMDRIFKKEEEGTKDSVRFRSRDRQLIIILVFQLIIRSIIQSYA